MISEEQLTEWERDTQKIACDQDEASQAVVGIIVPSLIAEVRRLRAEAKENAEEFDVPESSRWDCGCKKWSCVACCEASYDYKTRYEAREWGVGWARKKCIPTRLVRVTVRAGR